MLIQGISLKLTFYFKFFLFFCFFWTNMVVCLQAVLGLQYIKPQRQKYIQINQITHQSAMHEISFPISIIIFSHYSNKWHILTLLCIKIANLKKNCSKIGHSHSFSNRNRNYNLDSNNIIFCSVGWIWTFD